MKDYWPWWLASSNITGDVDNRLASIADTNYMYLDRSGTLSTPMVLVTYPSVPLTDNDWKDVNKQLTDQEIYALMEVEYVGTN